MPGSMIGLEPRKASATEDPLGTISGLGTEIPLYDDGSVNRIGSLRAEYAPQNTWDETPATYAAAQLSTRHPETLIALATTGSGNAMTVSEWIGGRQVRQARLEGRNIILVEECRNAGTDLYMMPDETDRWALATLASLTGYDKTQEIFKRLKPNRDGWKRCRSHSYLARKRDELTWDMLDAYSTRWVTLLSGVTNDGAYESAEVLSARQAGERFPEIATALDEDWESREEQRWSASIAATLDGGPEMPEAVSAALTAAMARATACMPDRRAAESAAVALETVITALEETATQLRKRAGDKPRRKIA